MAKKRKKSVAGRVFLVIGIIFSMAVGSMAATAKYNMDSKMGLINRDSDDSLEKVDISQYETISDSEIINILLVGGDKNVDEQNKANANRRSDTMMIATLDMKHKKLKVTSLMRDMYVEIPGHGSRKLNAAYSLGGISLLYETIVKNFGIKMDGYAQVNFDAFVDVINAVGGVEANITESEAEHLNTTNYIKRKKFRNLEVGKQVLNGYQALGYCRIRHGKRTAYGCPAVYTASGKADDYGRTERQRLVIEALVKKLKSMSLNEWMELVEVVLPNIKTDMKDDEIYSYMLAVVKMGTTEVNQYSLPIQGGYTSQELPVVGQCLVPDIPKNKAALHNFIYKK